MFWKKIFLKLNKPAYDKYSALKLKVETKESYPLVSSFIDTCLFFCEVRDTKHLFVSVAFEQKSFFYLDI